MLALRAHVETMCARGAGTHGDVLNAHMRTLNLHTVFFSVSHTTHRTAHTHTTTPHTQQRTATTTTTTTHGDRR